MLLKTVLNRLQRFKGFVYRSIRLVESSRGPEVEVEIRARLGSRPICSCCGRRGSQYDLQRERRYRFVPLWGMPVWFVYRPRRVDCSRCRAVFVEQVPWAVGKAHHTIMLQCFLSHWAKKLSWREVAREFRVSWNVVYRSIEYVVHWGLERRDLTGIASIGVDELLSWRGHRYVTVVYQIDAHCKRLLWVGRDRTAESFSRFFDMLGEPLCGGIRYVCSDMWKAYLEVVRIRVPQAIHVLDRFHIVANLNRALDEVRAKEAKRLKVKGDDAPLKRTRWCILKRPENLTKKQRGRLRTLLRMNLQTVRAYLLARDFQHLWSYASPTWAGRFLDLWCRTVMRSRIEPLKKMARQFRGHRELILNYFRARKQLSSGIVEAMNNNAKLTMRKAYGFRTFRALEIALFHQLGALPEPQATHRFW